MTAKITSISRPLCYWVLVVLLFVSSLAKAEFDSSQNNNPDFSRNPKSFGPVDPTVTTATIRKMWRRGGMDSLSSFMEDLSNLEHLKGECDLLTPTHSKRDSSYTKSWTLKDWEYHQVRALHRYARHLWFWPQSPTARAVLPAVVTIMIWSATVYQAAHKLPTLLTWVENSAFAAGSFTAPLSLLLALRTNRALDRLLEARKALGSMIRVCNSLAGISATYLEEVDHNDTLLIGRILSIFGWIVKGYLRREDTSAVLRTVLPVEEAEWLESASTPAGSDLPTAMIGRIRTVIARHIREIPHTISLVMEDQLRELEIVLGILKRLIASPIPPTYTRHTSRVLCLYLGLMPIALVSNATVCLSTILINVALLSYVFVGIDEIGVEIEHPIPLLPMYHLCKVSQEGIQNQFKMLLRDQPDQQQHRD